MREAPWLLFLALALTGCPKPSTSSTGLQPLDEGEEPDDPPELSGDEDLDEAPDEDDVLDESDTEDEGSGLDDNEIDDLFEDDY